jgi:hypothetical protein
MQFGAGAEQPSIRDNENLLADKEAFRRWVEIKEGLDARNIKGMYYLDFRGPTMGSFSEANTDNLGGFVFGPGSTQEDVNTKTTTLKNSGHEVIWTVSPGYYHNGETVKTFRAPDFIRIHKAYTAAIANNADKMLFVTWNDFAEDTDMAPSRNKGRALVALVAYYNEWFKTRVQPARDKSILVFASPLRNPETVITPPPRWSAPDEEETHQKVYYWLYTPEGSKSTLYFNERPISNTRESTCTPGRGCITIGSFDLTGMILNTVVLERVNEKDEKFVSERHLFSVTPTKVETQRKETGGLEYRYQVIEE